MASHTKRLAVGPAAHSASVDLEKLGLGHDPGLLEAHALPPKTVADEDAFRSNIPAMPGPHDRLR